MRGADPAITFLYLDREGHAVVQAIPAPCAAHAALDRPKRFSVSMAAFETCGDQFLPNRWQIGDMRSEKVNPLTARDLRVEVVFFCHFAQHDQFLGRDLPAGHAGNDRIASAFLDIGEVTVIAILDGRVADDGLVPAAGQNAGYRGFADLAAVPVA